MNAILGFMQTDRSDYDSNQPHPSNWNQSMPHVDPHMVKVQDFDDEIRLIFPGLEIWLRKSDLKGLMD